MFRHFLLSSYLFCWNATKDEAARKAIWNVRMPQMPRNLDVWVASKHLFRSHLTDRTIWTGTKRHMRFVEYLPAWPTPNTYFCLIHCLFRRQSTPARSAISSTLIEVNWRGTGGRNVAPWIRSQEIDQRWALTSWKNLFDDMWNSEEPFWKKVLQPIKLIRQRTKDHHRQHLRI